MSQATRTLKKIASSEEYRALDAAIREFDPETIFRAYTQLFGLLAEAEKEILERIDKLPRHNKDLDRQQFLAAFAAHSQATLPQWHWVDSEIKKQKVMEGEVFAFGSKGDPLVRTAEGRVVAVRGATVKEGDKLKFKVLSEGAKIDFGRVFELTPETLYAILTQGAREKILNSLDSLQERIESYSPDMSENVLADLGSLLKELEDVREFLAKLRGEEKERIMARIVAYRRRLLKASILKLVFEYLSQREITEIEDSCQRDRQQVARALSAPGLFCYQAHLSLKAELVGDDKPKGYSEIVDKLEKSMDTMQTALQLLDFRTRVEQVYPVARRYCERVDVLFDRLTRKAIEVAYHLAEGNVWEVKQIQSTIEEAFSNQVLGAELRQIFRSPGEFFDWRRALGELRTAMGNAESKTMEAALEPYLRQVINGAFGESRVTVGREQPPV
ncbi:MAG: hypothetical protein HW402_1379 [Dehalococcoidales bacterium]|nr:hypothetical protein [Dehalococcoidales bacterium]